MTERLLQFIWQFQYFNKNELAITTGEGIQIMIPGLHNSNQGPDFLNAKIKIGDTIWAGTIELHIKTSDWNKHHHQEDRNYNNVILHVVWEDDEIDKVFPINKTLNKSPLPVLELKDRISKILLQRYEGLLQAASFIPCEKNIAAVRDITWKSWKDRLLIGRLMRKTKLVETHLHNSNYHWEETFWWMLARNFGTKVNGDAFEAIAKSISINILAKHKNQIHQLEALLMGQAGLLNGTFTEDYPIMLQKEYHFYRSKYNLQPTSNPLFFLRMRPGNFPTIRLAQLAMLIHGANHLFSHIKEANTNEQVKQWFAVTANDYWHYHYRFEEETDFKRKKMGNDMVDNIIINTVVPVLFYYGSYHKDEKYKQKALQWLELLEAENNNITKGFEGLGIENKTAFDSQALIELKNEYCNNKRCLECGIGNAILKG